jgi:uncharacterized membrane protein YhaH (DUF805 family)
MVCCVFIAIYLKKAEIFVPLACLSRSLIVYVIVLNSNSILFCFLLLLMVMLILVICLGLELGVNSWGELGVGLGLAWG